MFSRRRKFTLTLASYLVFSSIVKTLDSDAVEVFSDGFFNVSVSRTSGGKLVVEHDKISEYLGQLALSRKRLSSHEDSSVPDPKEINAPIRTAEDRSEVIRLLESRASDYT